MHTVSTQCVYLNVCTGLDQTKLTTHTHGHKHKHRHKQKIMRYIHKQRHKDIN